jgi:hypothetical protein
MDHIDELIKEKADRIREEIKGGALYGRLIDLDNVDMVIVAAFSWGRHQDIEVRLSTLEQLINL